MHLLKSNAQVIQIRQTASNRLVVKRFYAQLVVNENDLIVAAIVQPALDTRTSICADELRKKNSSYILEKTKLTWRDEEVVVPEIVDLDDLIDAGGEVQLVDDPDLDERFDTRVNCFCVDPSDKNETFFSDCFVIIEGRYHNVIRNALSFIEDVGDCLDQEWIKEPGHHQQKIKTLVDVINQPWLRTAEYAFSELFVDVTHKDKTIKILDNFLAYEGEAADFVARWAYKFWLSAKDKRKAFNSAMGEYFSPVRLRNILRHIPEVQQYQNLKTGYLLHCRSHLKLSNEQMADIAMALAYNPDYDFEFDEWIIIFKNLPVDLEAVTEHNFPAEQFSLKNKALLLQATADRFFADIFTKLFAYESPKLRLSANDMKELLSYCRTYPKCLNNIAKTISTAYPLVEWLGEDVFEVMPPECRWLVIERCLPECFTREHADHNQRYQGLVHESQHTVEAVRKSIVNMLENLHTGPLPEGLQFLNSFRPGRSPADVAFAQRLELGLRARAIDDIQQLKCLFFSLVFKDKSYQACLANADSSLVRRLQHAYALIVTYEQDLPEAHFALYDL